VESRDWRYGWGADDPRWTEESASDTTWNGNGNGNGHRQATPAPDLWADAPPPPTYGAFGSPSVTSTGGMPALRGPSGQHRTVRSGYGLTPPPPPGFRERGSRLPRPPAPPAPRGARRPAPRPRTGARREEEYPDEPRYGTVLTLTGAWYLLPAVLYVVWLITVGNDRSAPKDVVGSLPWLLAAVLLSLAVAGLLRWAIVGWRALTLSFAAAVIGAGVATIAHSLSL
jgi:hypothetical protein